MPGVFVSHAFADKTLIDPFVDDVIRLGCNVEREQIFYSSGEDTGVPSGENLNTYVRDQVSDASIVVAIVSPSFQSRPFCVAELGAAWSRVGNLFPLAVPGMARTDLAGVLEGMLVKHLDEAAALDELHARISEALGHTTAAPTWGRFKAKWLANVEAYAEELPTVRVVTDTELNLVSAELSGTKEALAVSEAERRKLESQVLRIKDAKSEAEVSKILMPEDEVERFEHLRAEAQEALSKVGGIVADAMWYDIFEDGMPWPDGYEDRDRLDRAEIAKRDGLLVENSSDRLVPDDDVSPVARAYEAVRALRQMLNDEITAQFDEWFRVEYEMGPDLRKKRLWDDLLR